VKVLVTQLCPAVCDSMDCSPLGSSVHGILQVRIVKWGVGENDAGLEVNPNSLFEADALCTQLESKGGKKNSGKIIAKPTAITTRETQLVMCSFDFQKLQNTKHNLTFNILNNL